MPDSSPKDDSISDSPIPRRSRFTTTPPPNVQPIVTSQYALVKINQRERAGALRSLFDQGFEISEMIALAEWILEAGVWEHVPVQPKLESLVDDDEEDDEKDKW